ncbi:MAG: translation initiation factor eIF-1A [Candidatus Micrarchaeota archaeon]|nr:translation initiation factor eIF-1A [Candidatus Micrarchaeota archaeon]
MAFHRGGGGRGRGRGGRPAPVYELKIPQQGEVVGVVAQVLGASKFRIRCSDSFERICSIPGRLRRRFWIKENDIVVVKPWVVQSNERGDIVWRYSIGDRDRLKEKGIAVPL